MRLVNADPNTTRVNRPPDDDADGSTTRVLVRPVFTREGDGRRRLLVRGGYVAAVSALAFVAMVAVSVTASPSARPVAAAAPGVAAPTTVRQVTPQRPSGVPSAPVVAAPVTTTRVRPPAAATTAPPPDVRTTVTPAPATPVPPSASVKPTKPPKTSAPATTKTVKPTKTSKPRVA